MIIKFNLLPQKTTEVTIKEKPLTFITVYFSILSFILISFALIAYNNYSTLRKLESEKNEKQMTLTKYKNIAEKVKKLEKESEEIKQRIETLVNLKKEQGKSLNYLAELIKEIAPDKLIITSLTLKDNNAHIKGMGLDMDFLAYYMQSLENKKNIIKNVNLKIASQKELQDLKLVEFELEVKF